jgi:hypothetical protein
MFNKLSGAAIVTALTLVGSACVLFAASTDPALALCKYGTPHCVNPNPRPDPPKAGTASLPDGTDDPDCGLFNNCGLSGDPDNWGDPAAVARKGSPGTKPGRIGPAQPVHMTHLLSDRHHASRSASARPRQDRKLHQITWHRGR